MDVKYLNVKEATNKETEQQSSQSKEDMINTNTLRNSLYNPRSDNHLLDTANSKMKQYKRWKHLNHKTHESINNAPLQQHYGILQNMNYYAKTVAQSYNNMLRNANEIGREYANNQLNNFSKFNEYLHTQQIMQQAYREQNIPVYNNHPDYARFNKPGSNSNGFENGYSNWLRNSTQTFHNEEKANSANNTANEYPYVSSNFTETLPQIKTEPQNLEANFKNPVWLDNLKEEPQCDEESTSPKNIENDNQNFDSIPTKPIEFTNIKQEKICDSEENDYDYNIEHSDNASEYVEFNIKTEKSDESEDFNKIDYQNYDTVEFHNIKPSQEYIDANNLGLSNYDKNNTDSLKSEDDFIEKDDSNMNSEESQDTIDNPNESLDLDEITNYQIIKSNNGKLYVCKICNDQFKNLDRLRRHQQKHDPNQSPGFICDECKNSFKKITDFNQHKCAKINPSVHYTIKKTYVCDLCNRGFSRRVYLENHKLIHAGKKPFQCDICLKSFVYETTLNEHKGVHNGDLPFKCDICMKGFSRRGGMENHKKSHEATRQAYFCDICKKGFVQQINFIRHKLNHAGEKMVTPFTCNICDKSYTNSESLLKHQSIHILKPKTATHGFKKTKDYYECNLCTSKFKTVSGLLKHKTNHTDSEKAEKLLKKFQCDVCLKVYKSNYAMRQHRNGHTGNKPYVCKVCNRAFTRNSLLFQHMNSHRDEKPFECPDCNKKFTRRATLLDHQKQYCHPPIQSLYLEEQKVEVKQEVS